MSLKISSEDVFAESWIVTVMRHFFICCDLPRSNSGMLFNGKNDNSVFFVFRSAITLKEFLDIIEIAFITEVNMRRSVVPSAVVSLVTMLCKIIWLFNSESFFNDSGNNLILSNTLWHFVDTYRLLCPSQCWSARWFKILAAQND